MEKSCGWLAATCLFLFLPLSRGLTPLSSAQQAILLTQGMVIERSVTVKPGTFQLPASADLKTPAIIIRGENITVDFTGVTLDGSPDSADPDAFAGVAILVDGGSKVTISGGRRMLKLEYYEVSGWAEISLDIKPWRMRY